MHTHRQQENRRVVVCETEKMQKNNQIVSPSRFRAIMKTIETADVRMSLPYKRHDAKYKKISSFSNVLCPLWAIMKIMRKVQIKKMWRKNNKNIYLVSQMYLNKLMCKIL